MYYPTSLPTSLIFTQDILSLTIRRSALKLQKKTVLQKIQDVRALHVGLRGCDAVRISMYIPTEDHHGTLHRRGNFKYMEDDSKP